MSAIAPATLTAEEFATRFAGSHADLIDGKVRENSMPQLPHGVVVMRLGAALEAHVRAHQLGRVAANDTFVLTKRNPDRVRGADLVFWSYDRLPKGPLPEGLVSAIPEFVAEVMSPTDRWRDVMEKVTEYLQAGVSVVCVADPPAGVVTLFRPDENPQVFHNSDELTIPDLFAGLRMRLPDMFEDVSR